MTNTKPVYKSLSGKDEIMALYDAVLARWPVPKETCYLPTRFGDTFIIDSGKKSAPPLVLLHGAASNAISWIGDVPQYCRYFRVIAVDLPGEPGKSSENRPSWSGPDFAEWLEDVLDGLKVNKTALLGISQGGWTALRFATLHPERVTRLVLLAPSGVVPTRPSFVWKAIFLSIVSREGGKKINRIVFGKQDIHPDAVKFMDAILANFNARVEKEYIFTDEELKCLVMPTLIIGGTDDALIPMERVIPRMEKILSKAKTVLIPGMSHALVNLSEQIIPFLIN